MRAALRSVVAAAVTLAALSGDAYAQQYRVQIEKGAVEVPRGSVLIRDLDSVWTGTGEVLESVSILIRDGIIREIGRDVGAPRGVTVVDGNGLTAIPGLVDQHSHVAMTTSNECTAPIVPEVRVIDQLDPADFDVYRALSGGVTTAQILHGSCNPIGGQSAIIKMRWGVDDGRKLLIAGAPQTVKFALGENVTRKSWGAGGDRARFPASRAGVEALYVQAFEAAKAYRDAWQAYRRNPRGFRVPPRRDLRLEALVEIMEGDIRVHAHSYRADEIAMLMDIAERYGFKIDVFTHALEAYKVADELAAHGAGSSTFSDWWQYKLEAFDATPYNAAVTHERGVLTSLNSDIPWLQSTMVYELAKPVKYGGISRQDALRMLTLYPARQMLIADKVGSLEVGKHGDVVLLSGDPFDAFSRVETTIVDGLVYFDREQEEALRGEPVRTLPAMATPPAAAVPVPWASARSLPRAQWPNAAGVVALTNATVHPVTAPAIPNGVVVVRDGRIAAVGPADRVQVPADAQVVDLRGKHVYPGLIDPLTWLGLYEFGQAGSAADQREVGQFNPHIRPVKGLHVHSVAIPVTRANGISVVGTAQLNATIPSMVSLIQLQGDSPERVSLLDAAALVVQLPEAEGEEWDEPKLEGDDLEALVELFRRAQLFGGRASTRRDPTAPFEAQLMVQTHVMLEALQPVMRGEIPVFFTDVRTEREIRTLLMFLDEFPGLKPVLVEADQAYRLADELAARRIPVVVGSSLIPTLQREDPVPAGWKNAAILHAAGVPLAFSTYTYAKYQDTPDVRNFPYLASRSVAEGLPYDVALRAITQTPAELFGLGDELGSIDVGERADLIVTDGDPLQIPTQVERMWIAGREVSLRSKHTELYEAFRNRR